MEFNKYAVQCYTGKETKTVTEYVIWHVCSGEFWDAFYKEWKKMPYTYESHLDAFIEVDKEELEYCTILPVYT